MVHIPVNLKLSVSPEQGRNLAFLIAVSIIYLGFSLYQLELPGLYGDELDKVTPTVSMLTGQQIFNAATINIFGRDIAYAYTDYIGPVLIYLPMPFIALLGYTPFALRISTVLCGWLTIVFAYFGAKRWFGPWTAAFGIILTAVSPTFIFLQRMGYYNYGPVTMFLSITFFFLARFVTGRNPRDLWMSAAFAGIAINTAMQAVGVLLGMGLLALLFLDGIRPKLRHLAVAFGAFVLTGIPIIFVTATTGGIFNRIGWSGSGSGLSVATVMNRLDLSLFNFKGLLAGIDPLQITMVARDRLSTDQLMPLAFQLSFLLLLVLFLVAKNKKEFFRQDAAPMIITILALALSGLTMVGYITYQLIVLWPFATLAVGAALAQVHRRFQLVALLMLAVLVFSQLAVVVSFHRAITETGGTNLMTPQVYALVDYLGEHPDEHPVAMAWGMLFQIYFLSGGRILPDISLHYWPDIPGQEEQASKQLQQHLLDQKYVYIFFNRNASGWYNTGLYPFFERGVNESNRTVRLEKTFYERDGSVAYLLYRAS